MGQDGMEYLFRVRLHPMQMGSATCIFPLHPPRSLTISSASTSSASFISSLITFILLFFNAYPFSQVTLYSYCRNNNDSVKKLSDIFLTILLLFLLSTCTQNHFDPLSLIFPTTLRYSETSLVHLFTHNSSHTTLAQRAYIPVTFIFVFLFLFNARHSLIYREKGEKYDGDVK